jgi:hypothetical protein
MKEEFNDEVRNEPGLSNKKKLIHNTCFRNCIVVTVTGFPGFFEPCAAPTCSDGHFEISPSGSEQLQTLIPDILSRE